MKRDAQGNELLDLSTMLTIEEININMQRLQDLKDGLPFFADDLYTIPSELQSSLKLREFKRWLSVHLTFSFYELKTILNCNCADNLLREYIKNHLRFKSKRVTDNDDQRVKIYYRPNYTKLYY